MSSPAPKIRQRSVSYRGLRTNRYGPSTTKRCGTPFSSAPAPEGNRAPASSSLAHPIFATPHVPATTEPTKSTQPSTWKDGVPLQLQLIHHGESNIKAIAVPPQSPPTSMRYQEVSPRRLVQPRQKESIG